MKTRMGTTLETLVVSSSKPKETGENDQGDFPLWSCEIM